MIRSTFFIVVVSAILVCGCRKEDERTVEKKEVSVRSDLMWQEEISENRMSYHEAEEYCNNLEHGGHNDWRLPAISELRSLIRNCKETEPGGSCKITDDCLKRDECHSEKCRACKGDGTGKFSAFEDTSWFWSASQRMDTINIAWVVKFYHGSVGNRHVRLKGSVRCVR